MSEKPNQCLFNEPWVGQCTNAAAPGAMCCEEHAKEKCQVCGEQATTRCQASIGVMCGVPLCHLCGAGEMCIHHSTGGPLGVLRAVLGYGPMQSAFSDRESLTRDAVRIDAIVKHAEKLKPHKSSSMVEFQRVVAAAPEGSK